HQLAGEGFPPQLRLVAAEQQDVTWAPLGADGGLAGVHENARPGYAADAAVGDAHPRARLGVVEERLGIDSDQLAGLPLVHQEADGPGTGGRGVVPPGEGADQKGIFELGNVREVDVFHGALPPAYLCCRVAWPPRPGARLSAPPIGRMEGTDAPRP